MQTPVIVSTPEIIPKVVWRFYLILQYYFIYRPVVIYNKEIRDQAVHIIAACNFAVFLLKFTIFDSDSAQLPVDESFTVIEPRLPWWYVTEFVAP